MDRKSVTGQAAVVGAGVMGAQIAAHLANAGWRATLLDILPEGAGDDRKSRCAVAARGVERAQGAKPASFFLPEYRDRIVLGNTADDLNALRQADWIVEAVVEKEEIKKQVHAAIDVHAGPDAVVTTNTSALSIGGMSAGCSPSYRSRFFGTHFQPAALHEPPGADPDAGLRPRCHEPVRAVRGGGAGQVRRDCARHARVHREPAGRLRHAARAAHHAAAWPERGAGGRADRPAHRPPQERLVPP